MSDTDIQHALTDLPHWRYDRAALVRTTTFPSFLRAIAFVNAIAHLAERQDHHPDIQIVYHRVTLRYWTHRAKGVTSLDLAGAGEAEKLIPFYQAPPLVTTQE
jgi:4a-hydroxytetrahydrobiopterin dehydratase